MSETEASQQQEPESKEQKPETPAAPSNNSKIDIYLNAVGSSPIMKNKRWAVDQEKQVDWVIKFIHRFLKLKPEERIFLYVNQTFAPPPDQSIRNIYDCYGAGGKLNLYYCISPAWG
ncbi:autophagy protein 12-like [Culicoides brevitarsis]|uniref:autophagy protein 12-like n=1 Tax=Culicoides brevitarsis TaxID=469753 RepID=UPI00307CA7F3